MTGSRISSLLGALAVLFFLNAACSDDENDPTAGCAPEGASCAELECCDGLGCDFSNTCVPCVPLGQARTVDDGGCCEGLVADPDTMICEEAAGGTETDALDPTDASAPEFLAR